MSNITANEANVNLKVVHALKFVHKVAKFTKLQNPDFSETEQVWLGYNSDMYSEPCQLSKIERFGEIANGF